MPKEESFELKGVVLDSKPGEIFTVLTKINDKETKVQATLSGSIRRFRIKITPGDSVTLCMTPYDLKRARITYRDKK